MCQTRTASEGVDQAVISPRKERNSKEDFLRDCQHEDREANSQIFCQLMKDRGLDLVVG
jgi:hypothetical protein